MTHLRFYACRIVALCATLVFGITASRCATADGPLEQLPKALHQQLGYFLDADGRRQPIDTPAAWAQRRKQILAGMEAVMGPLPADVRDGSGQSRPFDLKVIAEVEQAGIPRQTISFASRNGERVTAYLYIPKDIAPGEKRAAILALHPTGAPGKEIVAGGGKANREYGFELAQRGYVVIAPDYVTFGDQKSHDFAKDDYVSGTMKGIVDHMRCVDLLQSRADVDGDRIGVIGHSLGGHNAVFAAVFDERIKAIVTSCGWCPFHDYYEGKKLANWAQQRYMPWVVEKFNASADAVPFDFYELVAALAPRPFYSNSPLRDSNFDYQGVKKAGRECRKIYDLLGASTALQLRYPDCEHDFPNFQRRESYAFLDAALKHKPTAIVPALVSGKLKLVKIQSTFDGTMQPSYIILPETTDGEKRPLLVSLHTWSSDLEQRRPELEAMAYAKGWIVLAPNFRGVNDKPEACGSKYALQDVLDAVEWTAKKYNVDRNRIYLTGESGGGHMTLMLAATAPKVWAAASAWCGINDLSAWHKLHADDKYGEMCRKCCGGAPIASSAVAMEYLARSPQTWLLGAKEVPLDIATGIYDGHFGSVPVSHSMNAFNIVARANEGSAGPTSPSDGTFDEDVVAKYNAAPWFGTCPTVAGETLDKTFDRTIYFRRTSGNCRLTLFEGGHERLDTTVIDWLSRHTKK